MERKYVYVMRGTKWMYKIGISNDPERRIKEVSHKPKLVATYRYYCAEAVETTMHKLFLNRRRTRKGSGKTEWFRLDPLELIVLHACLLFFKIVHDLSILFLMLILVVGVVGLIKGGLGSL